MDSYSVSLNILEKELVRSIKLTDVVAKDLVVECRRLYTYTTELQGISDNCFDTIKTIAHHHIDESYRNIAFSEAHYKACADNVDKVKEEIKLLTKHRNN